MFSCCLPFFIFLISFLFLQNLIKPLKFSFSNYNGMFKMCEYFLSAVIIVHPSESCFILLVPKLIIGSIAITIPSLSLIPFLFFHNSEPVVLHVNFHLHHIYHFSYNAISELFYMLLNSKTNITNSVTRNCCSIPLYKDSLVLSNRFFTSVETSPN